MSNKLIIFCIPVLYFIKLSFCIKNETIKVKSNKISYEINDLENLEKIFKIENKTCTNTLDVTKIDRLFNKDNLSFKNGFSVTWSKVEIAIILFLFILIIIVFFMILSFLCTKEKKFKNKIKLKKIKETEKTKEVEKTKSRKNKIIEANIRLFKNLFKGKFLSLRNIDEKVAVNDDIESINSSTISKKKFENLLIKTQKLKYPENTNFTPTVLTKTLSASVVSKIDSKPSNSSLKLKIVFKNSSIKK